MIDREEQAKKDLDNTIFSSKKIPKVLLTSYIFIIFIIPIINISLSASDSGYRFVFRDIKNKSVDLIIKPNDVEYIFHRNSNIENNIFKRIIEINNQKLNTIHSIENNLDSETELSLKSVSFLSRFMLFLGIGNEKVIIGKDNWLLYEPNISYLTYKNININENYNKIMIKEIVEFNSFLKEKGIELILLPVPPKVLVNTKTLRKNEINVEINDFKNRKDFYNLLEENDITYFDVINCFSNSKIDSESLYLHADSHWSPSGMDLVAEALSKQINTNLFNRREEIKKGNQLFITNRGDIYDMLSIPESIAPEKYLETVKITPMLNNNSDLIFDKDAEVLLLGDSYSNIYSLKNLKWGEGSGFPEQLAYHLNDSIDSILINDDGAVATRKQFLNDLTTGERSLDNLKYVVWEFAEREIVYGDWDEHLNFNTKDFTNSKDEKNQIDSLTINAKCLKASEIPNPKNSDYPDCLYTTKMEIFNILEGNSSSAEIIAVSLGFQDYIYNRKGIIKEGDFIKLNLKPYSEVSSEIKRLQTVDDIIDFSIPKYWVTDYSFLSEEPEKTIDLSMINNSAESNKNVLKKVANRVIDKEKRVKELDSRANDINNSLEALIVEAQQFGGWDHWNKSLKEYRADIENKIALWKQEFPGFDTITGENNFLFSISRMNFILDDPMIIDPDKNDENIYPDAFNAIKSLHSQLAELNIDLIVVPIPTRAEFYCNQIEDAFKKDIPVGIGRKYFIKELLENDIEAIDLSDRFNDFYSKNPDVLLYAKEDPHWVQAGAMLAAEVVSERLKRYDFKNTVYYELVQNGFDFSPGSSLLKKYPDNLVNSYERPLYESYEIVTENKKIFSSGDENAEVLLLGDSYSHPKRKFVDFLSYYSEYPIELYSQSGGGPDLSIYLAQCDPEYLSKKKVIIFTFVARYLPKDSWKVIELQ